MKSIQQLELPKARADRIEREMMRAKVEEILLRPEQIEKLSDAEFLNFVSMGGIVSRHPKL